MKLLTAIKNVLPEPAQPVICRDNQYLKLLFSDSQEETKEKVIYRKNGRSIDKIIEFDKNTGSKLKTTYFDYFNDKKIRSIDEYDRHSGKKLRTINYVLYKSVDEYDIDTGKKVRTINYNIKDDAKISSIQEYNNETGIITISIYKRDGKTVGIVKSYDPSTEKVVNVSKKQYTPKEPALFSTRCYDNVRSIGNNEDIAELIDNLYSKGTKFEHV